MQQDRDHEEERPNRIRKVATSGAIAGLAAFLLLHSDSGVGESGS
jgi:hypothetical protein